MALLQGHLLRYKSDPEGAIRDTYLMAKERNRIPTSSNGYGGNGSESSSKKSTTSKRRVLTVEEVDRMVFNPQEGWDKNIPTL